MVDAIPVARMRGSIMRFLPDAGCVSNFVINGGGILVFVRIRKAQRLYGPLMEIEAECREPVSRLRSLPGSGTILRELWCYSRYGTWRYFRVGDSGMTEIGPQGLPVPAPAKDPAKPGGGPDAAGVVQARG
jgi:hypothetical protein